MNDFEPSKPMRNAMYDIQEATRQAIRIQTVDIPKVIDAQKIAAQLQPDWDTITAAMKVDSQSISNALTVKLDLIDFTNLYRNSVNEVLSNIKRIYSFNQIDFSNLFKINHSFSSSYFEDFRKNVIVNEALQELEEHQEATVSLDEFNELKEVVFRLKSGRAVDSKRIDDLERKYQVQILTGWLISILQLYGVSLDIETIKDIVNSFVEMIKIIVVQNKK